MDIDLYLAGRHIAHTEPVSRGSKVRIAFEEWVEAEYPAETVLLSCAMPTGSRSEPAAAQAFLEGLLPEGQALQTMAAGLSGVSLDGDAPRHPYDAVNLLAAYGRECAGAVTAVPRGDPAPGADSAYQALDEDDVEALLRGLPTRPLGTDIGRDIRMSLAGAQPKLLLALLDGQWQDPVRGAASTHILKPTGRWASSADNECIVMTLANRIGLTRSAVRVDSFGDRRVFVAARFDRVTDGAQVSRLHQEDLGQATKIRPKDKYHFGPLSGRARLLIRDTSSDPARDVRELFRQLTFRTIVGDEDGHAKNYGFMLHDGSVSLAPLYDSLTTMAYGELSGVMGTPVGRQSHLDKIDLGALIDEGRAFRLGEAEARTIVESLASRLVDEITQLDPDLADPRAMDVITTIIRTRARRLLDGEPMGEVERRLLLDAGRRTVIGTLDQVTLAE